MKRYKEMAMPRKSDLAKTYYHGTDTISKAKGILKNGIWPGVIDLETYSGGIEHSLTPRENKVYITPELKYAVVYALGANVIGVEYKIQKEKEGFLFVIDGKKLKDIEPDEDSIGEMIYNKKPLWLYNLAKKEYASDFPYAYGLGADDDFLYELETNYGMDILKMVASGDYTAWAMIGKALLASEKLTDAKKLELITAGAHIAHTGNLPIKEAWKIDKSLSKKLKPDCSNFFKLAKRIK